MDPLGRLPPDERLMDDLLLGRLVLVRLGREGRDDRFICSTSLVPLTASGFVMDYWYFTLIIICLGTI